MVIIYPPDSTTEFLSNILNEIIKSGVEVKQHDFHYTSLDDSVDLVKCSDDSNPIIYLGHGTKDELNVNNGEDNIISLYDAKKMFKNKKILLISCYSSSFIKSLNGNYISAIGFGNIITSEPELKGSQRTKYNYNDYECIEVFKKNIVEIFQKSIVEAIQDKYSVFELHNGMRLRMNKSLSKLSMSKNPADHLAGELLFDLKNEMVCLGNRDINFNGK